MKSKIYKFSFLQLFDNSQLAHEIYQFLHVNDYNTLQLYILRKKIKPFKVDQRLQKICLQHDDVDASNIVYAFTKGAFISSKKKAASTSAVHRLLTACAKNHMYDKVDLIVYQAMQGINLEQVFNSFKFIISSSLLICPKNWFHALCSPYKGYVQGEELGLVYLDEMYTYRIFHAILVYMYMYDIYTGSFLLDKDLEPYVSHHTMQLLRCIVVYGVGFIQPIQFEDDINFMEYLRIAYAELQQHLMTHKNLCFLEANLQWYDILSLQSMLLVNHNENDKYEERNLLIDLNKVNLAFTNIKLLDVQLLEKHEFHSMFFLLR